MKQDRWILEEYTERRVELKDLRKRIERQQDSLMKLRQTVMADTVSCGKKGRKPIRTVRIQGIPAGLIKRKEDALEKNQKIMELKEVELLEMQTKAEEYIESIPKSELRTMFRLYFIDDMTYAGTAMQMNNLHPKREVKYTDENIKKKIQRFFENVPQCPDKMC